MLVLTRFIANHELKPLERYLSLADVIVGAKKVIKGLAIETKPPRSLPGLRFFKVRLGSSQSARMIVFVVAENQKIFPLIIRLKKDKTLGINMAMNNPALVKQMNINLDWVLQDIENQQYQEFNI